MSRSNALDTATVHRVWTRFCKTGDPGYLRDLPNDLSASWQRSLIQGVDPGLRRFPICESNPNWDKDEASLIQVIEDAIVPFRHELHDSSALLAVIGLSGRIVYRDGNAATLCEADVIGSIPGALTLEGAAGTNSAGTALFRHAATSVARWEHFCEAFWSWSDVGVPILHPRSCKLIGMVDIGLPKDPITPTLVLAAKAIAASIEKGILQKDAHAQRAVLRHWSAQARKRGSALFAFDRHGAVLCADDGAIRLLSRDANALQNASISDVPELQDIADELQSCTAATYKIMIGERETMVVVEPARVGDELAGAIVRLDQPRPRTHSGKWESRYSFSEVIGQSAPIKRVVNMAQRLAGTDLPVLLYGETGTGKELLAHAMHAASVRAEGPFVTVNCGAIPHELIASELFGYEKGAFTGANRAGQRGKFEQANGGTIFLDEITETSQTFQVSLLRVIQDGAVVPVGAEKARAVDVRIISATNRVPGKAVTDGILRSDLFYRLNGAILALPALRERREDIPVLVKHFCAEIGRCIDISAQALAMLMAHDWPGNLRELHAVIRSAALLTQGSTLEPEDLPATLICSADEETTAVPPQQELDLQKAEVIAIERAMLACNGNIKQAAAALGIGRSSLYRKLKRMALTRTWTLKSQQRRTSATDISNP